MWDILSGFAVPELCRRSLRRDSTEASGGELPLCLLGDSFGRYKPPFVSSSTSTPFATLPAMQHPKSLALLGVVCSLTVAAAGSVPRGVGPECKSTKYIIAVAEPESLTGGVPV